MDKISLSWLKKKAQAEGGLIVYADEATFRQSPTIAQTWAPINTQPQIPTEGQRFSKKVFGAVTLKSDFVYRISNDNFSVDTYLAFLEEKVLSKLYRKNHRLYFIQDNASYHKAEETYKWFKTNRKRIEVFNLPPYFPELNAIERIWHYTRCQATHNRYYPDIKELQKSLQVTFATIILHPEKISGLLAPFF